MAPEEGRHRKRRDILYGNVVESIRSSEWVVDFDDGVRRHEKSTQLRLQPPSAGLEPLLPISHAPAAAPPPPSNGREGQGSLREPLQVPPPAPGTSAGGAKSVASRDLNCTGPTVATPSTTAPASVAPVGARPNIPGSSGVSLVPSEDPDQAHAEDMDEDSDDDDDDDDDALNLDAHQQARVDAERFLAAQVGHQVTRENDQRDKVTWTVVTTVNVDEGLDDDEMDDLTTPTSDTPPLVLMDSEMVCP